MGPSVDRLETVAIAPEVVRRLHRAAAAAYPAECCGFLFAPAGPPRPRRRAIVEMWPSENPERRTDARRFRIPAESVRAAEADGAGRGRLLAGFYHSHPDASPRPSEPDRAQAWPWYVYVIASSGARAPALGAYQLDPERGVFRAVPLEAPAD